MTTANPYLQHAGLVQPLIDFGMTIGAQGLETSLQELIKIRASQLNGCAICLAMHSMAARAEGESELRVVMLDAWRESALYSARERAALGWTEALTRLTDHTRIEEARAALAAEFSEEEQVKVTLMIIAINGFNRIGVGFGLTDAMAPKPRKAAA